MATLVDQEVTWAYAADIVKSEPTEDGHLMVHGKAASPTLDLDGQICDPKWLAAEMPDWFRWGNVRAQHGPVAAGVGKTLEADGADGWDLASLIVDTDSKEKVRTGVYKGYSVGIKGAKVIKDASAPNGRIVGGKIVEISLVDRPCNPDSKMTLVKSAGTVTTFEDPGDPESALVETEILGPTDALGDLIDPDEEQDTELSDIVKGFIEFLRGPKAKKPARGSRGHGDDQRKRDQDGRFARRQAAQDARDARLREREQRAGQREADTKRAIEENQLSTEALADAEHARQSGRREEATEHAAAAAGHAHDSAARRQVAVSQRRIGKSTSVDSWDDASDEALEYAITKAAQVLANRYGKDDLEDVAEIVKGLMPDSVKRFFSAAERREAADEGNAMADGSFPIKTQSDLDNAVKRAHSGSNPAAAKAHIRAMAKKHGLSLPDGWDGDNDDDDTRKAAGVDGTQGSIIEPEITKALQAQQEAHRVELAALRAELAGMKEMLTKTAAPDANAPVLVAQPMLTKAANPKADEAAAVRRDATRATDPVAQRALMAYAERLEAGL